jgi:ATP-grasp domain, R2K clade family 3
VHIATSVHWVIQENQTDSLEVRAIIRALELEGHEAHLVPLMKGSEVPLIPDLPKDVPVVCQGPAFVPRALNYPRLRPGLFFDPSIFRRSAFRTGWGDAMLSSDGMVVNLSSARALLRERVSAFIRPDFDSKAFDGGIYDAAGFAAATEAARVSETTAVVVASPIDIEAEWRFFIVDREIVGCSEYKRWGRLSTQGSVPRSAIDLAAESASNWGPADIYCLDLAATENRIGIVEANCFNASRFYAAVIDRVLEAVNAHVVARFHTESKESGSRNCGQ